MVIVWVLVIDNFILLADELIGELDFYIGV